MATSQKLLCGRNRVTRVKRKGQAAGGGGLPCCLWSAEAGGVPCVPSRCGGGSKGGRGPDSPPPSCILDRQLSLPHRGVVDPGGRKASTTHSHEKPLLPRKALHNPGRQGLESLTGKWTRTFQAPVTNKTQRLAEKILTPETTETRCPLFGQNTQATECSGDKCLGNRGTLTM